MASAARVHAIERGKSPERCTMIAFGGAAPLHAARLAAKLGMRKVLVPVDASVGSAVGFLRAPVAFEVVRSLQLRDDAFDFSRVNHLARKNAERSHRHRRRGRAGREARDAPRGGDALPRPGPRNLRAAARAPADAPRDATKLRAEYESALRSAVRPEDRGCAGGVPDLVGECFDCCSRNRRINQNENGKSKATSNDKRSVFDPVRGKLENIPSYRREELAPGARLAGPALVVEPQTTTLVPRGWRCSVTGAGHLILETHEMKAHEAATRPPDPLEPPDRGGRGAGQRAAEDRVRHHHARSGRPVGRRLRHQGAACSRRR